MKQIIMLSGGLGNQMFQYAFFLSCKEKGMNCVLDKSLFYFTNIHNGFELRRVFGIQEHILGENIIYRIIVKAFRDKHLFKSVFFAKEYTYAQNAYNSKRWLFVGDWLSYKYFENIKHKVFESYKFQNISLQNTAIVDELRKCNSVSIHIRRGDYLNMPFYCVCNEYYYKTAIELIKANINNPIFYVFSNEPKWCVDFMKNFNVKFKIVDWNQGLDSYQDMYLMTQCKHNIIANSTFSWWGAWLNPNPSKIVIAPSKWFKNSDDNINLPDWKLIDTLKNYE